MSRFVEPVSISRRLLCLALVLMVGSMVLAAMDVVTLQDGSEIRCRVLRLDQHLLEIEHEDGEHEKIAREKVVAIEFGEDAPPLIKARVRVYAADDEVRLFLGGEEIASVAELRAGWVDLAPLLGEGANEIYAEVTNEANLWSYRWTLEVGGSRETFECGLAGKKGCREGGRSDRAQGTFPAGRAWIYVHRRSGEASIELP